MGKELKQFNNQNKILPLILNKSSSSKDIYNTPKRSRFPIIPRISEINPPAEALLITIVIIPPDPCPLFTEITSDPTGKC